METVTLKTTMRNAIGGREPLRLRKKGLIPGVVYGKRIKPASIQVDRGELEHALHTSAGENVIITLSFQDAAAKDMTVIIKDVQHNVVHDTISHVDFNEISLTEKIKVKVPIHTKGEPIGVTDGGVLDLIHRELTLECLPTEIPPRIDVEIGHLKMNDSIHIKEIKLPAGVVCLDDPEEVAIIIFMPRLEEVASAAGAVEGEAAAGAEPEVIKKGKEEVEGEEGAAVEEKDKEKDKDKK